MGTSKIILVSGLCVMLGFYAYVIQQASQAVISTGTDRRARVQARMMSAAAINVVAYCLSTGESERYNKSNRPMSGGTVSWAVTYLNGDTAAVTGSAIFGADTVVQYAALSKVPSGSRRGRKKWSQWSVQEIYMVQPTLHDQPYVLTRQ